MNMFATSLGIGCAALILAACGSASSNKAKTTLVGYSQALKFSNCMRANGLANFPDPSAGGGLNFQLGPGLNPQSPSFQSAQKACSKYEPGGGGPPTMSASERGRAVKFAQCMRTHGETDFPDPSLGAPSPSAGAPVIALRGMFFKLTSGGGINPMSPAFKQAAAACGVRPPPGAPANAG